MQYVDVPQSDPLPRYARAGIGFEFGISYSKDEVEGKPFSFKWTIEANDMLVRRYDAVMDTAGNMIQPPGWEYEKGLGDINFFDEVILGKTNKETVKKGVGIQLL